MYLGVHEINSKQTLICSAECVGGLKCLEVREQTEMMLNCFIVLWYKCIMKKMWIGMFNNVIYIYIIHETVMIQIHIRHYRLEKLLTENWEKKLYVIYPGTLHLLVTLHSL